MFLSQITIKNFRGIKSLDLNLADTTVLIGENNTGKSTILDALQYCLNRLLTRKNSIFTEYDYHLADESGDPTQEFNARSPFWKPFVRSLKVTPERQTELENALSALNQQVLDAHDSFSTVKEKLGRTNQYVPLGSNRDESVTIEAIPRKIFDMLSRTQVMLTAKTGARLPIGLHGEGTQSLAVICLFDAFLEAKLTEEYDNNTVPILALEEPEAHLHPSAIRAVAKMLQSLKGQKIMTTHSGELVAGVPLTKLRRLRRKDGEIKVYQLTEGALTKDELHKLDYHVRLTRGNLLFARCWLLVEGETEPTIFNECARIMGVDLFAQGVCCVEYAQVGVEKFIKLADQLGIEWLVVADKDKNGNGYIQSAKNQLANRDEKIHLHQLEHGDMEVFLCMNGYGLIFEQHRSEKKKKPDNRIRYWEYVSENLSEEEKLSAVKAIEKLLGKKQPTEQLTKILNMGKNTLKGITEATHDDVCHIKDIEYWKQVVKERSDKFSKPQAALAIIEEIEKPDSAGIPPQIQKIINQAISLAEQSA